MTNWSLTCNYSNACQVDGIQSDMVTVDSGVPQGPILGPILFLLHINDLPSVISSKVRLFTDDCLVYREIKNKQDQIVLQEDLNLLKNWGSKWGLRFNVAKCNIMRMSKKQTPISIQYAWVVRSGTWGSKGCQVPGCHSQRWLGVNAITTKANSKLSFLRCNLKGCPEKLRETVYFSLVRSFLEYSATVWHPHQKYNSDNLEMVPSRATRFVKGRYRMYESITQMLEELTHYQKDVKTLVSFFSTKLLDWRQCGNSLALWYFAVVMELPHSLWMNCKSEFGVIFLRCSPTWR